MGLESSPDRVDECWENDEWAEALVNDCVYRIGFCFAAEGDKELGLGLIRLYLDARLDGSSGTYSPEEVAECLSRFGTPPRRGTGAGSLLKAFQKLTADVPVSASTAAFPS
jgi:hypothetical protein